MSELKNAAMLRGKSGGSKQGFAALFSKQSSVAISTAVSSYDSMSWAELRACCGKKHGNSISAAKKDNEGRWKPKSKKELMSELKNAALLRGKPPKPEQFELIVSDTDVLIRNDMDELFETEALAAV